MRCIGTIGSRLAAPTIAAALIAASLAGPAGAAPYDNAGSPAASPTTGQGAISAPDGHAGTNVRVAAAVFTAPDSHAAVNPRVESALLVAQNSAQEVTRTSGSTDPSPASTAGDSTNWPAIGFGVFGGFLLLVGTTLLVRRHVGDHRHAAHGV